MSINGGELYARAGRIKLVTGRKFPLRTGLDFAGEIAEFSSPAAGLTVGDQVWGIMARSSGFGSAAQYVVVRPERISRSPKGLDPVDAVALPVGITAITFDTGRIAVSLGCLLASAVHGRSRVRFFSGNPKTSSSPN